MAKQLALIMCTMIIFLLLTVLTTRMWQDHRTILRFSVLLAITEILRHVILSITVVAIRTSPRKER